MRSMSITVIYRNGVFVPTIPVDLMEETSGEVEVKQNSQRPAAGSEIDIEQRIEVFWRSFPQKAFGMPHEDFDKMPDGWEESFGG
ncbi:hypothetical protein BH09SUM1_BH09SUM1_11800 [soil metagenome]